MFRKKYDISGKMSKEFPEWNPGVIVTKYSPNLQSDDDTRTEQSYTNLSFVGDEPGKGLQAETNQPSNMTGAESVETRLQDVELDDLTEKGSANDRIGTDVDSPLDVSDIETPRGVSDVNTSRRVSDVKTAHSVSDEDTTRNISDVDTPSDVSDVDTPRHISDIDTPHDVSDKIDTSDSNVADESKDQDDVLHDPDTVPDSGNGSLKKSFSFGDRPSKRHQSLQTEVTPWEVDKYVSSQRAVSLGDKSSSTETAYSDDAWRLSMEDFTSKRQGSKRKDRKFSKEMRSYYKQQDEQIDTYTKIRENISFYKGQDNLINQYEEIRMELDDAMDNAETQKILRKKASFYAKITFVTNLALLAIKVVAVSLSGSISLVSSLVDSAVDLLSGLVIWATTRAVKKTDRYVYPQGRTKLEPMAIVILSVIMSVASLQIIKEAFAKIIGLADTSQSPPGMDWITIAISSATVIAKLILFLLCRRIPHPTVLALALDHRNDVMSNFVAIFFGYIGSTEMQAKVHAYGLVYLDPIGAILISIYIIANWIITGWDQIKLLVGHTATSDFISKITWICVDHHKKVEKVDTVRAFHFGNNFLVEVDIVLPPEMTLKESHDIAEPLQQKLERLPNVERAFVHVDYEFTHDPKSEHKVV